MPRKLLLADDSVTIQRVIELTFADEDVQVAAVSDGDQAIAKINAEPPDIVLADIGMPGKDGYEVAAHVKQTPRLAHIPVLLLTGAFEPVDQARIAAIGCEGVLSKPFEPQQVISRVRDLLGRQGSAAVVAPPIQAPVAAPLGAPPAAVPAPPPSSPGPGGTIDDYFDRLDAAFANAPSGPAAVGALPASVEAASPGGSVADQIDWYAATAQPNGPDLPLSYSSQPSEFSRAAVPDSPVPPAPAPAPAPTPAAAPAAVPAPAMTAHEAPPPVPSLAEAFSVLLAAEQAIGLPPVAPTWPAAPGNGAGNSGSGHDEIVQQVTKRVLAELSDGVVRQAVADIVSGIAERLVRDEIERIKASIK